MRIHFLIPPILASITSTVWAAAAPQADDINRVIDEGFNRSQVTQTEEHLADSIGGRLTNSPQMREAEKWTTQQLRAWGLSNVRKEGFDFGRGWYVVSSYVRMSAPRPLQLTAIPIAWTPGTNGTISAPVIVAPMGSERDFDAWRGRLAGKIVLVTLPGEPVDLTEPPFKRWTSEEISKRDAFRQPVDDPTAVQRQIKTLGFPKRLDGFLKAEGAVAWANMSSVDGKLVHGLGYRYRVDDTSTLPGVEIAAEDYRRLARLAKVGPPPILEINSDVRFDDSDHNAYNIIAEIPGSDPKGGYVMTGAHLDSWAAGDGAMDNGAGSSIVMEAARILAKVGLRPKRTIRFALWSGEEQGMLGSRAYVEKYLATRRGSGTDDLNAFQQWVAAGSHWPITPQPGYGDLKVYFNLDGGSGKIRGVFTEGNVQAVPLLKEWLAPFASMGAVAVLPATTGGTDNVYFKLAGLAGYQFLTDLLDAYRVYHNNLDTFDHVRAEDMRQAAVVVAGLLLQAANSDKTLPVMPLPTEGFPTDPYKYDDPDKN